MHAGPSTGRPLLCEREKIKAGMRNKLRRFRDADRPMLGDRTDLVLLTVLVLLVADVRASWDQNPMEVLGDVSQLEASMHSSVLSDLREAEAAMSQPGGLPDSSAVVGRVFQMQVPIKAKDSKSKIKVRVSSFKAHGILKSFANVCKQICPLVPSGSSLVYQIGPHLHSPASLFSLRYDVTLPQALLKSYSTLSL